MNVLLTGSEGFNAKGLIAMRQALIASGFNVLTVAPSRPWTSGARSVTTNGRLTIEWRDGDDKNPVFSVDGTPVDCVRVAILSGLARESSVVIAGVDEELCLGDQAFYSSSVGAAIEGAVLGYPSFAISQPPSTDGLSDFNWGCVVGGEMAAWLGSSSSRHPCALNINVPALLKSRHMKVAVLAERVWSPADLGDATVNEVTGSVSYESAYRQEPHFESGLGTDAAVVASGHVAVSVLKWNSVADKVDTEVNGWINSIVRSVNTRIGFSQNNCSVGCCG